MASNREQQYSAYIDTAPAADLDRKTLNRMVWRSCQLQAAFNYERMQSAGWEWAILPGLEKIHTNKDDLATSMVSNMEFINTHPFLVTFVMGIVLSMEQMKADVDTISSVRISVASPLGGVGDALFWFTLCPITAGLTAQMAIEGNILGPILFFIIMFGAEMALRYGLMYWSYSLGMKAVGLMTKYAQEFTHAAAVLGIFVVGALISSYGDTALGISIPSGQKLDAAGQVVDNFIVIQDYLNMILPCLIPLLLTLMNYFLIKKKGWTPGKCILLTLALGIIGAVFGIWAGSYTPLVPVPWNVV